MLNNISYHPLVALKTCSEFIAANNTLKTVLVMVCLKRHREVEVFSRSPWQNLTWFHASGMGTIGIVDIQVVPHCWSVLASLNGVFPATLAKKDGNGTILKWTIKCLEYLCS